MGLTALLAMVLCGVMIVVGVTAVYLFLRDREN